MFDLREEQERVILVGVQENGGANAEESLDELAELPAPPVRRWRAAWCRCGSLIRERTSEKENRGIENSGARLRCDGHHLRR